MKADVQIRRVHKRYLFNISRFISDVIGNDADAIFNSSEIQKTISETFGRKLIVDVMFFGSIKDDAQYLVTKRYARTKI